MWSPTLSCLKITGPGLVSLMSSAASSMRGEVSAMPHTAPHTSTIRFMMMFPVLVRGT